MERLYGKKMMSSNDVTGKRELEKKGNQKLVLPGIEPGTFALSARRTTDCAITPEDEGHFQIVDD